MPSVTFVEADGVRHQLVAASGYSAMRVAVSGLVPGVVGECGGDLSCATCHVYVDPEWLAALLPMSSGEADMLEATAEEPTDASRLACQIVCDATTDGIVLHVPRSQ